jgi:hypothetical protein
LLVVGLLASACASGDDADVAGSGAAISAGPTTASAAPTDLTPAYWNVDALADSPSPGSEPLNVIITTNIPMDTLVAELPRTKNPEQGLAVWRSAPLGIGLQGCISDERATIDGAPAKVGKDAQTVSLRLGGSVGPASIEGCEGVVFDGESHARGWKSASKSTAKDAAGKTIETWYFALSQEHVCFIDDGGGLPKPWHCILPQNFEGTVPGISGQIFTAPTGGYNQGRDQFVANLKRLAEPTATTKWTVDCKSVERASPAGVDNAAGPGEGLFVPVDFGFAALDPDAVERDPRASGKHILKRVTWDSQAMHCTIMQ